LRRLLQMLNFKSGSSSFKIFNSNDLYYWCMSVILVLEPLPLCVYVGNTGFGALAFVRDFYILIFLAGSGIN